jgi:hypothetical protein
MSISQRSDFVVTLCILMWNSHQPTNGVSPSDMELPVPAERRVENAMEGSEGLRNYMEALAWGQVHGSVAGL